MPQDRFKNYKLNSGKTKNIYSEENKHQKK